MRSDYDSWKLTPPPCVSIECEVCGTADFIDDKAELAGYAEGDTIYCTCRKCDPFRCDVCGGKVGREARSGTCTECIGEIALPVNPEDYEIYALKSVARSAAQAWAEASGWDSDLEARLERLAQDAFEKAQELEVKARG